MMGKKILGLSLFFVFCLVLYLNAGEDHFFLGAKEGEGVLYRFF